MGADLNRIPYSKLLALLNDYYEKTFIMSSDVARDIFSHTTRVYNGKPMPKLYQLEPLTLFFETAVTSYTAEVKIPILNESVRKIPELTCKVYNEYTAKNFAQFCLTEGIGACLCYLTDGTLAYVPYEVLTGNESIVSIIQFSSAFKSFVRNGVGLFTGCRNLVYIPPLPEGVKDFSYAFKDCVNLNCPIYLPSTAEHVEGMLAGCTKFDSSITGGSSSLQGMDEIFTGSPQSSKPAQTHVNSTFEAMQVALFGNSSV